MENKLPSQDSLRFPTLLALKAHNGSASVQEIKGFVAQHLELSDELLEIPTPHPGDPRTKFEYDLAWARTKLKLLKAVINPSRSIWEITEKGSSMKEEELNVEPSGNTKTKTIKAPNIWICSVNIRTNSSEARHSYEDTPSLSYNWSNRSNIEGNPERGDWIVVRDEDFRILGMSIIEDVIEKDPVNEIVTVCPKCKTYGNVRTRPSLSPLYRCYKRGCGFEFETPDEKIISGVIHYETRHEGCWIDLDIESNHDDVVFFSKDGQASIRSVDRLRFESFLKANGYFSAITKLDRVKEGSEELSKDNLISGGHRKAFVKTRIGQGKFRKSLLSEYGENCAISGPAPSGALDACHLYSYAVLGEHHEDGGLLLRSDLHSLFDRGKIWIDAETEVVHLDPSLKSYSNYWVFDGEKLCLEKPLSEGQKYWLNQHFEQNNQ